jgi:hypothetical protein
MRFENIKDIDLELQKLEEKKLDLLEQRNKLDKLTKSQLLANIIHKKQCRWNHIDGCGWDYESWDNPGYSRLEYLKKAESMLKNTNFETAVIVINQL